MRREINRPVAFWPWLALLAMALVAPVCIGLTSLGARQIDLFHVAFFNGCAIRAYELHWQDARRYPDRLPFDFTKSPDSLVSISIWIKNGPTLSFTQRLPLTCRTTSAWPFASAA